MRQPAQRLCLLLMLISPAAVAADSDGQTLLLRQPTLSDNQLAFVYAGDLWITNGEGGDPRRLTSHPADERRPHFSPDGAMLAFSANYAGNYDVYVMPAAGGEVRRLTFHPRDDDVTGWTADGRVAFSSAREVGNGRSGQLYEIGLSGGLPSKVMEAPFFRGAWHGDEIAYLAYGPAYNGLYGGAAGWKGYRGGSAPFIRILDPSAGRVEQVPGGGANDIEPMWDGDRLYFLSDREHGVFNVYSYERGSASVRRLSNETVWDIRSADAHGGRIVYEAGGRLKQLDPASGATHELAITLRADLPQTRPAWKNASANIEAVRISPSGRRALITARGEVFSVPTEHGSTRNLTRSDGVREYTAIWSPDGERVAYVSDHDGRQYLHVVDQAGLESPQSWPLPGDYHELLDWGGDGANLVFRDNHLNLYLFNLNDGRSRHIASQDYRWSDTDVATSPDGRWIAYTLIRPNLVTDLMIYQVANGRSTRVSDGMADVTQVTFSPDGQYLYFAASTNSGPTQVSLDLSSQERPLRLGLYAVVLSADGASPLAPRTGDEEADADQEDDAEPKDDNAPTRIDLEAIGRRIVALPVAERNYTDLAVDKDGNLLFVDRVQPGAAVSADERQLLADNALRRFDFDEREVETIAAGITRLVVSRDGSHMLARNAEGEWASAELGAEVKLEPLDTSGMRMRVDPRREWAQIFDDAWRMEQAFFYADNLHGLDWQAIYQRYRPLLDHAGRREDVNELLVELIAELRVGHNNVRGGDVHRADSEAAVGLLGADLRVDNGRYRIQRIYDGASWNPFLSAPLTRPGLGIEAGDYLLAVNGRELDGDDNVFEWLQGTAGKQTTLRVAPAADVRNARDVTVLPVDSERELRLWDWVEGKRQRVAEATDDRVAYVYLPDTAGGGYTFFNRMFFPQTDKQALIIDERSNGGGQAANYIIDVLGRDYLASWTDRDGLVFDTPGGAIYGPKVMLVDQDAGSGGDFLPYAFRRTNLGTLIGTRTWGGLIGISANPNLIDGGILTVPFFRFFTPAGEWAIENRGVAPDIEVALDPVAFNRGEDVQLERAIREVLQALDGYQPVRRRQAPALPTEPGR